MIVGIFIATIVLLIIFGLLLIVFGWRGTLVDDHAHCGLCSYDLSGMVVDMRLIKNREGQLCSECGAELGEKKGWW